MFQTSCSTVFKTYFVFADGQPIEEGEMSTDPEFLAEMMELNEEISEAESR